MKETKKIIIIIFVMLISIFAFSCNDEKVKEDEKANNNDSIEEKTNYKVEFFNDDLVSGDSEMYDYYLLTKEGKPLTITITYTFEKGYYNKNYSYIKVVDTDVVTEYELVYDGDMYYFYDVTNSRSLLGSYEYLNYSKYENRSIHSSYIYRVGYVISNNTSYTYETYIYSMSSSDSRVIENASKIIPIVHFVYSSNLTFTNNKILNISYYDGGYKYYYSDYSILTTTVLLLNQLSWTNDLKSIDSDYSFPTNSKKINISMSRTLLSDENGLMLKELGEDYLLNYKIDLDYGIISMGYTNISTSSHNLYAKLTNEQIEQIKGIIKEDLIKDFTVGEYSYKSNTDNLGAIATIYRVRLFSNNKAEIVKDKYYENGDVFIPVEDKIVSGRYYIDDTKTEKELVITNNEYTYRFKLSYNENKSIKFVLNGSNPNNELFKEITEEAVFYYGEQYIYGTTSASQDKVLITRFNSLDNQISSAMLSFIEGHESSYENDTLWRVGTNHLNRVVTFYKFEKSCETFMEFDGVIYEMGPYFGGNGVTQLAYYHEGDKYVLYYILSYGSGIHRSEVYSFDFKERDVKKVEEIDIPLMIDIEFGDLTTNDERFILSIYESTLTFAKYPFWCYGEKQEILVSNILDINK